MKQVFYASKKNSYQYISKDNIQSLERYFDEKRDLFKDATSEDSFIYSCETYRNINYATISTKRIGYDITTDNRKAPYTHIYYEDIDNSDFKVKIKENDINRIFDRVFIDQDGLNQIVTGNISRLDVDVYQQKGAQTDYFINDGDLAIILSFIYSERKIYIRLPDDKNFYTDSRLLAKKIYRHLPYALRLKCGCAVGFAREDIVKESIKIIIGKANISGNRISVDLSETASVLNEYTQQELENNILSYKTTKEIIDNAVITEKELFEEYDYYVSSSEELLNGYDGKSFNDLYKNIAQSNDENISKYYQAYYESHIKKTESIPGILSSFTVLSIDTKQDGIVFEQTRRWYIENFLDEISFEVDEAKNLNDVINDEYLQRYSFVMGDIAPEKILEKIFKANTMKKLYRNTCHQFRKPTSLQDFEKYVYTDLKNIRDRFQKLSLMYFFIDFFKQLLVAPLKGIKLNEEELNKKIKIFYKKKVDDILINYEYELSRIYEETKINFINQIKQETMSEFNDDRYFEIIKDSIMADFENSFNSIKQEQEKDFVSDFIVSKLSILTSLQEKEIEEVKRFYEKCVSNEIVGNENIREFYDGLCQLKNEKNRLEKEKKQNEFTIDELTEKNRLIMETNEKNTALLSEERKQIDEIKQNNRELESRSNSFIRKEDDYQQKIKQAEDEIDKLINKINTSEKDNKDTINSLQEKIEQLEKTNEDLKRKKEKKLHQTNNNVLNESKDGVSVNSTNKMNETDAKVKLLGIVFGFVVLALVLSGILLYVTNGTKIDSMGDQISQSEKEIENLIQENKDLKLIQQKQNSEISESYLHLANDHYDSEEYLEAKSYFQKVIELETLNGVILYRYAYSTEQVDSSDKNIQRLYTAAYAQLFKENQTDHKYYTSAQSKITSNIPRVHDLSQKEIDLLINNYININDIGEE